MTAETLSRWIRGLTFLASETPPRLSTPQLVAFVVAGLCDYAGQPTTMSDLRRALGPLATRSAQNSYAVFLEGNAKRPYGIGWLGQRMSPVDGRERLLILTPEGRRILDRLGQAIANM